MPLTEEDIVLGATYKDVVTGFTGVAMVMTQHLTACTTVGLEGTLKEEGASGKLDYYGFDITRLEHVADRTAEVQRMVDAVKPPADAPKLAKAGASRLPDEHVAEQR